MQMNVLGVKQNLIPLHHPEANPVERKNRDMKVVLVQFVGNDRWSWSRYLPAIRFAFESAVYASIDRTLAFLMFGREMRDPMGFQRDIKSNLDKDNFVSQNTAYLRKFAHYIIQAKEHVGKSQNLTKDQADRRRKMSPICQFADLVLL
ncbi:hypothetical protein EVAR_23255_1 [Eumeta japonica]|uniref:Integrase catalytic domain-containing protein n=1 Tax=Eumeta variegata TaxID=151549 RepID=A0A4C1V5N0_EUMVA|nr:hypothetical protein EVAR_23255_1 [Eumeta japonica]